MHRCVYQHPDSTGKIGVELSRDLVKVAAKALTHNLTKLGPKVLPWSEKLLFAANWVGRKMCPGKWKEYVPDFREAFDHFCLHAGRLLPFKSAFQVCLSKALQRHFILVWPSVLYINLLRPCKGEKCTGKGGKCKKCKVQNKSKCTGSAFQ